MAISILLSSNGGKKPMAHQAKHDIEPIYNDHLTRCVKSAVSGITHACMLDVLQVTFQTLPNLEPPFIPPPSTTMRKCTAQAVEQAGTSNSGTNSPSIKGKLCSNSGYGGSSTGRGMVHNSHGAKWAAVHTTFLMVAIVSTKLAMAPVSVETVTMQVLWPCPVSIGTSQKQIKMINKLYIYCC
jgi:hypothetical protein